MNQIYLLMLASMLILSPVHAGDDARSAVAVSTPLAVAPLFPPKPPSRAKDSLDSAGEVARDLAVAVEYFEAGQAYFRAYTKGSHTPEENKAFVRFLEDYEKELAIARRTHTILGSWIEKKSSVRD